MLKVFVTTCDKYAFLMEPYSILFNKYWPNQSVEFLGFDESLTPPLPENFKFTSLGNQQSFGASWADPLIPFFESLKDEYFVLTVDDVFLMNYVDIDKVEFLENELKAGLVQKASLISSQNFIENPDLNGEACSVYKESLIDSRFAYPDLSLRPEKMKNFPLPNTLGNRKHYTPRLLEIPQGADYRTSLAPAIWNKKYFLNFLKPGMSIWNFEVANMPQSKNDGAKIISIDQPYDLFEYCNAIVSKGSGLIKTMPFVNDWCVYGTHGSVRKADVDFILSYVHKCWN